MDTIIIVLFLLLPTIFGLIGKKFQAAAQDGTQPTESGENGKGDLAETMKKLSEMFGMEETAGQDVNEDRFPMPDEPVAVEPVSAGRPNTPAATEVQNRARAAAFRHHLAEQTVQPKHKETIDPKKLVIYSEIMKPKYLE